MSYIDLHVHSNISDGTLTPTEIVSCAIQTGLSAIALTDHDTIDGVQEALEAAAKAKKQGHNIDIIAGTELSVAYKNRDIHILGLYLDIHNAEFQTFLNTAKEGRLSRNRKMVLNLQNAGIDISMEDLMEDNDEAVITRAHFAKHLVKIGVVKTKEEAFRRYLDSSTTYYVPRELFTPEDAIQMIHRAGGIASLAHPLLYKYTRSEVEKLVVYLKSFGLDALETYYSSHTDADEYFVRNLAKRQGLLMTGGSDFHGANKPDIALGTGRGKLKVPAELLHLLEPKH